MFCGFCHCLVAALDCKNVFNSPIFIWNSFDHCSLIFVKSLSALRSIIMWTKPKTHSCISGSSSILYFQSIGVLYWLSLIKCATLCRLLASLSDLPSNWTRLAPNGTNLGKMVTHLCVHLSLYIAQHHTADMRSLY